MPERPDLEYVIPILDAALRGRVITGFTLRNPVVLRMAVEGRAEDALVGATILGVQRRLHFFHFQLDGPVELIVSPMLAGRFLLCEPTKRMSKDTAAVFEVGDEQLRYRDDVQMGKVYVIPQGRHELVPGFSPVGVDVLSRAFTLKAFKALASKRRDQVKLFLMDKSALDAMGNAYADEALFAAGVHPKLRVRELSDAQLAALHKAIRSTLKHARDEVARRKAPTDEKVRDFLKVRNRKGQPCPTCGAKIRAAGVRGHDAFFCPECQPDSKGRGFVDWRKTRKPGS